MGDLVVIEFVTLDGTIRAPRRGRPRWLPPPRMGQRLRG